MEGLVSMLESLPESVRLKGEVGKTGEGSRMLEKTSPD